MIVQCLVLALSVALAAGPGAIPGAVKVKSDADTVAFTIKPKDDGLKVVDGKSRELWRLTRKGDKVKVKNPADEAVAYVTRSDSGKLKIKDAHQKTTFFVVVPRKGGHWSVEDGADTKLYRIKRREYGYEIETPDHRTVAKVKVKDGKTSLRDGKDRTTLYTKDKIPTLAFAAFALDKLSPPQRMGLFLQLAGQRTAP